MGLLSLLGLAFAPGLFWMWTIQRRGRHRPEQRGRLVRVYLLGVAVAFPVVVVGLALGGDRSDAELADPRIAFYQAFVVAGLVEELGKWLVVRSTVYDSPEFDRPLDGLVYASAAALGFASIENLGYMLRLGAGVIVGRSVFSTLAHVIFASLWGYPLGWAKQASGRLSRRARMLPVAAGLAAAIALHGLFDFFLLAWGGRALQASIACFVAGAAVFLALLRRATRTVADGDHVAMRIRLCPGCLAQNVPSAAACAACGLVLPLALRLGASCGKCKRPIEANARYCGSCGRWIVDA